MIPAGFGGGGSGRLKWGDRIGWWLVLGMLRCGFMCAPGCQGELELEDPGSASSSSSSSPSSSADTSIDTSSSTTTSSTASSSRCAERLEACTYRTDCCEPWACVAGACFDCVPVGAGCENDEWCCGYATYCGPGGTCAIP